MNPLFKYQIKRVMWRLGIRVRPGKPRRDLYDFLVHIRRVGFRPATVIDVGVADGTFELYQVFPEARHLLVEPMAEFEDALKFICRRYNAVYVIAAASDKEGSTGIHFSGDLHGASLLQEMTEEGRAGVGIRQVRVARLDTLATAHGTSGPYLIKVDVQGSELTVLDGAVGLLPHAEVIVLETSLFRFKAGGPVLDEVIAYMKQRGFAPYEILGGHTRPLDGALAQVDMAFVKKDGQFRRRHLYATADQIAAHERKLLTRIRRVLRV